MNKELHISRPWLVNSIAEDFFLWDVWEIPVNGDNSREQNFQTFYTVALKTFTALREKAGAVSMLFAARQLIGRIFPFDRDINTLPIPGSSETSVQSRMSGDDRTKGETMIKTFMEQWRRHVSGIR